MGPFPHVFQLQIPTFGGKKSYIHVLERLNQSKLTVSSLRAQDLEQIQDLGLS